MENLDRMRGMIKYLKTISDAKKLSRLSPTEAKIKSMFAKIIPNRGTTKLVVGEDEYVSSSIDLDEEDINYFINKYNPLIDRLTLIDNERIIKEAEEAIAEARKRLENI